jgi:hypothetical protein
MDALVYIFQETSILISIVAVLIYKLISSVEVSLGLCPTPILASFCCLLLDESRFNWSDRNLSGS